MVLAVVDAGASRELLKVTATHQRTRLATADADVPARKRHARRRRRPPSGPLVGAGSSISANRQAWAARGATVNGIVAGAAFEGATAAAGALPAPIATHPQDETAIDTSTGPHYHLLNLGGAGPQMRRFGRTRRSVVLASVAVIAASVSMWSLIPTGSAGATVTALDNFECSVAASAPTAKVPAPFPSTPKKESVKNVFAPGGFGAAVGSLQLQCDPTRKTVVSAGHSVTSPITNANAHLACWTVKPNALKLPSRLTVKNQFGTSGLERTAARGVCLPSWEATTIPPKFPSADTPPNLDDFACYAVVHPSGTPTFKPPASVHLQDQFGSVTTSVAAPNMLCCPAPSRSVEPRTWTKIVNPTQYAVCFAIASGTTGATSTVYDKNRFGVGAVKVGRDTDLCLPSLEVTVAPPTTTSAPTTTAAPTTTTTTTTPGTPIAITSYADATIKTPIDITAGPDGALWFTNAGNDSIGRITTDGTVTNYTDPSIAGPDGITVGPDGGLWFTNARTNTIGRITTDGSVSHFSGTGIDDPLDITAGPDGALWFTNNGNSTIGRITTAGVVSNFKTDAFGAVSYPDGIAAGPDGTLWFANTGYPGISQITTAGAITRYYDATVSTPYRVTAGPDGAMWFTNSGNGSIGRIATDGTISNYPDPTISDAQGIVTGPDGALWFANYGNNTIGRITTDGTVTDYNNPAISLPDSITVGPDGALWFTNIGNSTIGRIAVP